LLPASQCGPSVSKLQLCGPFFLKKKIQIQFKINNLNKIDIQIFYGSGEFCLYNCITLEFVPVWPFSCK
jgi:hypothetical protein